ncbi:hypothetical protein WMF11_11925 [Sorangium sp. So ce295]|uniref:hypothetical protein n=1 Tax=Sorangium sp. So ce295 TaxID=3133295 RepID=UPI003F6464DF
MGPAILLVLVLLRSLYELPLSFPRLAERDQQYLLWLAALALAIGCALPAALMYWVQTRASESLKDRERFQVPQATSDGGDVPDQHASEAKQLWKYECDQMARRNDNIALQMNFYGLFATLAVALGAVLLLGRAPLLRYDGSLDAIGAVALAATTAAVICFLGDAGQAVFRLARRDVSARMFAWATRRFVIIVTRAILLAVLLHVDIGAPGPRQPWYFWVLAGASIAIVGEHAATAVSERISRAFGLPPPAQAPGEDLRQIQGLNEQAIQRLQEEGVDSVEALAFHSIPRLFLSTPFVLHQLCDWQDQALLLARVGPEVTKRCRDQLFVRGATELRRLARAHVEPPMPADQVEALARLLGLESAFQVQSFLDQLARDPLTGRLEAHRRALPFKGQHTSPAR